MDHNYLIPYKAHSFHTLGEGFPRFGSAVYLLHFYLFYSYFVFFFLCAFHFHRPRKQPTPKSATLSSFVCRFLLRLHVKKPKTYTLAYIKCLCGLKTNNNKIVFLVYLWLQMFDIVVVVVCAYSAIVVLFSCWFLGFPLSCLVVCVFLFFACIFLSFSV